MNTKIEIIPASHIYYENILAIAEKENAPFIAEIKKNHGCGLADVMEAVTEPRFPKDTTSGYIALIGDKVAGYADYNGKNDGSLIGEIGFSTADPDFATAEIRTALFSHIISKMREDGKKHACVHASLRDEAISLRNACAGVGFTRGLPEIMYHMELANLPEIKVNTNIKSIPANEEHTDAIKKITVSGWTPIRAVQKSLLGEEIYSDVFRNWEESKCRGVLSAAFADPSVSRGYVAILDGAVAGFVTARYSAERKLITVANNSVSPDFAGKGIGSTLYSFILNQAKDEGKVYANVLTGLDDAHAPARRAYEKAGFTRAAALEHITYYMSI